MEIDIFKMLTSMSVSIAILIRIFRYVCMVIAFYFVISAILKLLTLSSPNQQNKMFVINGNQNLSYTGVFFEFLIAGFVYLLGTDLLSIGVASSSYMEDISGISSMDEYSLTSYADAKKNNKLAPILGEAILMLSYAVGLIAAFRALLAFRQASMGINENGVTQGIVLSITGSLIFNLPWTIALISSFFGIDFYTGLAKLLT